MIPEKIKQELRNYNCHTRKRVMELAVGLPTQTRDTIDQILEVCRNLSVLGLDINRKNFRRATLYTDILPIHVGSVFIPSFWNKVANIYQNDRNRDRNIVVFDDGTALVKALGTWTWSEKVELLKDDIPAPLGQLCGQPIEQGTTNGLFHYIAYYGLTQAGTGKLFPDKLDILASAKRHYPSSKMPLSAAVDNEWHGLVTGTGGDKYFYNYISDLLDVIQTPSIMDNDDVM